MLHDIFFLSYDELNADKNYQDLKERFPRAKRVHGVQGILNAHKVCAKKSLTKYFFVVDGDNYILPGFNFEYPIEDNDDTVYVWRALNPVNNLKYGYGGVKLLPKKLILSIPDMIVDMTTSLSKNFKVVPDSASITYFNTSPFNAWRGAFRECVKLASKSIDRQKSDETEKRLDIWCSEGINEPFGEYVLRGANEGREFGYRNRDNTNLLKMINDFKWLEEKFNN